MPWWLVKWQFATHTLEITGYPPNSIGGSWRFRVSLLDWRTPVNVEVFPAFVRCERPRDPLTGERHQVSDVHCADLRRVLLTSRGQAPPGRD